MRSCPPRTRWPSARPRRPCSRRATSWPRRSTRRPRSPVRPRLAAATPAPGRRPARRAARARATATWSTPRSSTTGSSSRREPERATGLPGRPGAPARRAGTTWSDAPRRTRTWRRDSAVRAYVARALARRARTRSGGSEHQAEPSGDPMEDPAKADPAETDKVQQPKRPKRQVDDDQVNNDTSRAPEPDNLTGAQAEVDPEPGATKTETAKRADGKAHAESSASEKGKQAASDTRETAATDADADGSAEAAEAEATGPDAGSESSDSGVAAEEEPSEAVLAELVSARAEAEGYLDDLRRLQAEFDNYRKRTMREQTARIASASQALVSRLLPVLDNFELAVSHAEQSRDFDRMLKGVEMVFGELNDVLVGEGLVAIEATGKPFDPERHEAVVAVEEDGVEAGTVIDVIRKGYEFNGRVLRPAMVKVAR